MKYNFKITGLDCANCAIKLEDAVSKIQGVKKVSINFMTQKMDLEIINDKQKETLQKVKKTIKEVEPDVAIEDNSKSNFHINSKLFKIILAAIIYIIAILNPFNLPILTNVLYITSYIIVGFEILKKALINILHGEVFDENFLMSIATLGAFCINQYSEAVAVMLFYQVGELFQSYSVEKSRKSITKLMDIRPDSATVIKNQEEISLSPEDVKIGDVIIVKPGEKVPLDGVVVDGSSTLDTKALTGEAKLKSVSNGSEILSGCINIDGTLKVKVTTEFKNSTVNRILDLVENASSKKSKSENFITKFAKYYTPIVVILALLIAIIPPLVLSNTTFSNWIYRALSFLVVSCPCALVISIPLSFFGGIGACAKSQILVKGSSYLENLSNVKTIVFDKTGTLTQGVFEVQEIHNLDISKEELLKFAAYAEEYSNHPIALSIKKAYSKEIDTSGISNTKEITSKGMSAKIFGKDVLVGNKLLMDDYNIKIDEIVSNLNGSCVYVSIDNKYVGYIIISDKIKPEAKAALNDLRKSGIKNMIILTGDNKNICENVAQNLNIEEFYSELLPDEKVEKLQCLIKTKPQKLAFVGDGINDAPVLAMSDIAIAMGNIGSDAAIEAADIVIMNDNLLNIKHAISISKKTLKIVKQNIIFAICIKIIVLTLSAIGISTMWEAVFADVGVSVIAILNSLRCLRTKDVIKKQI